MANYDNIMESHHIFIRILFFIALLLNICIIVMICLDAYSPDSYNVIDTQLNSSTSVHLFSHFL
jgi:hypothetical protein